MFEVIDVVLEASDIFGVVVFELKEQEERETPIMMFLI